MNQRFSGPPQDPTAGDARSKSRTGRWMAGALVLMMVGSVMAVRLHSRRVGAPAMVAVAPESEVDDSSSTDGKASLATVESGLGTEEVLRRLAAIERATEDPKERARLTSKLIGNADLKAPGCGAAFWDFALGRLNDIPSLVAVFEALGRAWYHADKTAAWTFLTHPERTSADPYDKMGISRFSALNGLLLEWMRSDVPGALEQARLFEEPLAGPRLLVSLYRSWFATAPQDALAGFATEASSRRHAETKSPAESSKDWPSPVCSPLPCSGRMKWLNPVESAILPRAGVEEHLGGTVGTEDRPNTKVGPCFHFQESAQRAGDFEAEPGRWSGRRQHPGSRRQNRGSIGRT